MKKFSFRLQRVLEYRHSLKKDKERELAIRNQELFSAEERLAEIVAAQDEQSMVSEHEMTMAELKLAGEYQVRLREALVNQRLAVLEAAQAVDDARQAYIEKAVEAEMLDTLKERHRENHKVEQTRHERKVIGELATQRHRSQKR